jgi:hypothetical protein
LTATPTGLFPAETVFVTVPVPTLMIETIVDAKDVT